MALDRFSSPHRQAPVKLAFGTCLTETCPKAVLEHFAEVSVTALEAEPAGSTGICANSLTRRLELRHLCFGRSRRTRLDPIHPLVRGSNEVSPRVKRVQLATAGLVKESITVG